MEARTLGVGERLVDSKYSDLKIHCQGKCFSVHRMVVCPQSRVLARECDGHFKEAHTQVIEHVTYDAHVVDKMLQFMYRGDYTPECAVPWTFAFEAASSSRPAQPPDRDSRTLAEDPLIAHVYVYAIADYYEILDLKALAFRKWTQEKDVRESLKSEELLVIAAVVYENTSSEAVELRRRMLTLCYAHRGATINNPGFMKAITDRGQLQEFRGDFFAMHIEQLNLTSGAMTELHERTLQIIRRDGEEVRRKHQDSIAAIETSHAKEKREITAGHIREKERLQAQLTMRQQPLMTEKKSHSITKAALAAEKRTHSTTTMQLRKEQEKTDMLVRLANLGRCPICYTLFSYSLHQVGNELKAKCRVCEQYV